MMNFHITDTFTDNFAKIIRRDQNAVKTTFKTEINEDDWTSPNSDTSQHLDKPKSGRIPVKVFDNFWDEVKKAIRV